MNVRLSYSTELKEVPAKVVDMLATPDLELNNQSRKIGLAIDLLQESDGKYASVAYEVLDDVRQALSRIDQHLLECQSIMEGYMQAQNPEQSPELKEEQEETQEESSVI